jgi:hypothetical protein
MDDDDDDDDDELLVVLALIKERLASSSKDWIETACLIGTLPTPNRSTERRSGRTVTE